MPIVLFMTNITKTLTLDRRTYLLLAGITFVGVILRVINFLPGKSLWGDEFFTIKLSDMSLVESIRFVLADVHAPLYYVLEGVWLNFFGISACSARFLSLIASIVTIPAIFYAGKHAVDHRVGLLAALFVAISPYHLQMSNEAREYAWAALAGTILVSSFLSRGLRGNWPFQLMAIVGVYLHHYFWPMLAVLGMSLKSMKERIKIYAPILIVGLPMLWIVWLQMHHSEHVFDAQRIAESFSVLGIVKKCVGVFLHLGSGYYLSHLSVADMIRTLQTDVWGVLVVVTLLPSLLFTWVRVLVSGPSRIRVCAICLLVLVLGITFVYPIRASARYFACFSSLFFIVTIAGTVGLQKPLRAVFFLVLLTVNLGNSFHALSLSTDPIHREDYKAMTNHLIQNALVGDWVVGGGATLEYYFNEKKFIPSFKMTESVEAIPFDEIVPTGRIWVAFYGDKEAYKNIEFENAIGQFLKKKKYVLSGAPLRFGGNLGFNYLYLFYPVSTDNFVQS